MKISLLCLAMFCLLDTTYASSDAGVNVVIRFQQAKNIYNHMTGPAIKNDGAAGHLYRIGKSITCQYTNVEMSDNRGRPIPMQDPRHYVCKMKFNSNGLALPKQ